MAYNLSICHSAVKTASKWFSERGDVVVDDFGRILVRCVKHPLEWIPVSMAWMYTLDYTVDTVLNSIRKAFDGCESCLEETSTVVLTRFPEGAEL